MKHGWEVKKLGEVVRLDNKRHNEQMALPYVGMEDITSATGQFIGSLTPKTVKGGSFAFQNHHLLYGRLRPYLNKVLLPNFAGHCSTEVFPIKPNDDLDKRFLFYWLTQTTTVKQIDATCTGARMPRASMNDVLALSFYYPSLPEQQRIVAILDETFAAIAKAKANAEQNLKNAKELFESYLQSVFENKGEGWEEVRLSELAIDITDGDHMPPPKTQEGVPFITISNINKQNHQIDFSDTFTVSIEYFQKLKGNRKPKKGDVLYTVTGSYGIPVLIEDDVEFCFQRHIGLIRPKENISSKWLYYWILSPKAFMQANDT